MKSKKTLNSRTNTSLSGENVSFFTLEAYKSARTNIIFAMPGNGSKTVMFTSSIPREGKTTTCLNTAIVFAQAHYRVLLLDCDLRKPRIHKLLRTNNDVGITDVLVGIKQLDDVIKHDKKLNLDYITCGTVPKTPAELLSSDNMRQFLYECSSRYDYIMIDTSPVNMVTDALVLAPLVTGIFFVARQNYTLREVLKEAISKFEFVNCPPTGIILNDTSVKKSGKYSGYYKKYYKAGYTNTEESKDGDGSNA